MEQHTKIINNAAKQYLVPEGLFRVGSSRNWIEDNGYFLTIVDFQPSGYIKGSYLNVGISFMWESSETLNDVLAFNYGSRVIIGKGQQFAEYRENFKHCDELFTAEIEKFANAALKKVYEYRKFNDLNYAKKSLLQKATKDVGFWEVYDLAMICFFKGDFDEGKKYFNDFLSVLKDDMQSEWVEEFYNICLTKLAPQLNSAETSQKMVFDMINRRRAFFNGKASYKKMRKDIIY